MKRYLSLILLFTLTIGSCWSGIAPHTYAADQRILYTERVVGAGHPTFSDTLNRHGLVEHNNDGTHNLLTQVTDPYIDVRAYGADPTGVADSTTAIQAAIDAAQVTVSATFGINVPSVYFPAGTYAISSQITKKSAPWIGDGIDNTTFKWNGNNSTVAIVQDGTSRGGVSATGIEKMSFYEGSAKPLDWLQIEIAPSGFGVDVGFRLRELRFRGVTRYHIDVEGYTNLHWEHLRFDEWDGYAIRITPHSAQNLSSFNLSNWTADHMAGSTGEGFLLIENDVVNATNMGTLRLANFRYENNATFTGRKGFITITGNNPDCVQIQLENGNYQDVGDVTTGDSLVHLDSTGVSASVVLQNFIPNDLDNIFGGTLVAGWGGANIPVAEMQYANISRYNAVVHAKTSNGSLRNIQIYSNDAGAKAVLKVFRGAETDARIILDSDGKISIGDGTAAPDVSWDRFAADTWKTNDTVILPTLGIGTNTPGNALHVKSNTEHLRLDDTSATGNPFLTFYQSGTRKSYIQHNDTDDDLQVVSEFGKLSLWTATAGDELERLTILSNGWIGMGGVTNPVAQVHVDQDSTSAAIPVLTLDQGDINDTFVNFIGTSAADGTRSISSDTNEASTKFGAIRIEINGVTKWIRIYDAEN